MQPPAVLPNLTHQPMTWMLIDAAHAQAAGGKPLLNAVAFVAFAQTLVGFPLLWCFTRCSSALCGWSWEAPVSGDNDLEAGMKRGEVELIDAPYAPGELAPCDCLTPGGRAGLKLSIKQGGGRELGRRLGHGDS